MNEKWSFCHFVICQNRFLIMDITNTQECFVQLWLRLGRTRRLLAGQHKRFCIRNLLRSWFGLRATDDFIWEVVHRIDLDDEDAPCGYDELPLPSLYPRKHRELLRAIVSVRLGISYYRVNLRALDAAYSVAFPKSTAINVNKRPTPDPSRQGGEGSLRESEN